MATKRARRVRTANYSEDARARLGEAVEKARLAAGIMYRPDFAAAIGIKSVRSIEMLENGEPGVGQTVLFAVGRGLPNWTEDTPKIILEGGPVPPIPEKRITPSAPPSTRHEWSAAAWQRMKDMTVEEAVKFVEQERVMRGDATALLAMRAIVEAQEEARREKRDES
ncbi:hypothetical protein NQK81_13465 [Amycolatopsis roodepoortensis]|uniref:hypothetical protein n=1 Tax=Amycolatopsis roodepoortensis TaxID=700274 RepID=UPI00214B7F78|nr:hypothetical protein [Amycolatopsis roodepoortensis]UUV34414.1 hypothetical protein NQK81_13465 [Amycolatopsis roodepoortensis]